MPCALKLAGPVRDPQTGRPAGLYGWAQHSNPGRDALTTAAVNETDEARREKLALDTGQAGLQRRLDHPALSFQEHPGDAAQAALRPKDRRNDARDGCSQGGEVSGAGAR